MPITSGIVCDICGRFFDISGPNDFYEGGTVALDFGYGSKFDAYDTFIDVEIEVCDGCFERYLTVLDKILQKRWDEAVRDCETREDK